MAFQKDPYAQLAEMGPGYPYMPNINMAQAPKPPLHPYLQQNNAIGMQNLQSLVIQDCQDPPLDPRDPNYVPPNVKINVPSQQPESPSHKAGIIVTVLWIIFLIAGIILWRKEEDPAHSLGLICLGLALVLYLVNICYASCCKGNLCSFLSNKHTSDETQGN